MIILILLKKIEFLKRYNNLLPELILEIIVYGFILQMAGVWFFKDKLLYSSGLWVGIILAIMMMIHMAIVIFDAVDMLAEKRARVITTIHSIVRYVIVAIVMFVVCYFRLGNFIAMILGIMGVKAAAYFHPFAHKFIINLENRDRETTNNH